MTNINKGELDRTVAAYKEEIARLKELANENAKHKSRAQIMARDNYKCRLCGSIESLEVHHMLPKSLGGKDDNDNRITLCYSCHLFMHCNPILVMKQKELHKARTLAGLAGKKNVGKRGPDRKQRASRAKVNNGDQLLALL